MKFKPGDYAISTNPFIQPGTIFKILKLSSTDKSLWDVKVVGSSSLYFELNEYRNFSEIFLHKLDLTDFEQLLLGA